METDRITKVMRSISSPPVIPLASSHQLTENTKFLTSMTKSEEMESVSSPQQTKENRHTRHTSLLLPRSPYANFHFTRENFCFPLSPVIPLASSHQLTENTKFLTSMTKSEEMESVSSPQQTKENRHTRHTSLLLPRSPYANFHFTRENFCFPLSPGTEDDHEQPMTPHLSEPSSSPSTSPKGEIKSTDSANKLAKRESYKAQRKNYRREKKRVARELLSTLKDPSIIILADWLKVRGTLKGWTKLWCVLKPGLLLLYKSPKTHKSSQWVGTVLLNACELIERPSKKDGFCFKLFHPLEQSIWASKGPQGEAIGALVQPLPMTHLIFRAPSEAAGKCWMDGLELALRCPSLLIRSMSGSEGKSLPHEISQDIPFRQQSSQWNESDIEKHFNDQGCLNSSSACSCQCPNPFCQLHIYRRYSCPHPPKSVETTNSCLSSKHCPAVIISTPEENRRLSLDSLKNTYESSKTSSPCPARHYLHKTNNKKTLSNPELTESEKHNNASQAELVFKVLSSASASLSPVLSPASSSSFHSDFEEDIHTDDNREIDPEGRHSYHSTDSDSDPHPDDSDPRQEDEEEIEPVETPYVENGEEEFGLVRPGMDLSKVVLPTFILEPRSFLDKLSDYYYHSDIISRAVLEDDPFTRMKTVVQWYLSGFYKKPKGLKKPYNPILGETFRCYWKHPNTGSRTFYIAEQVQIIFLHFITKSNIFSFSYLFYEGCLNSSSACSCQCPNPFCQLHIYRRYSCPHPPKSVETTNSCLSSKHCPAVIISTPEENRRLSLDSLKNTYESSKTSSPCPARHYLHKTNNKKTLSNPELTESEKHNNASQAELVFKVLSSASASLSPVLSPASSSSFHSDFEEDIHTDDNREIDPEGRHSYHSTDSDSDPHPDDSDPRQEDEEEIEPVETPYVENGEEEFGLAGDAGQTEEVADENKSLIWSLVKQVRPGMDLSKVVLPTFILEPRSFLDKLSDYYYHSDIISRAVLEDDPFTRMKTVVQWYLSGFYKKPKGLKKPYNPILGETFRCYWKHPNTGSRTFYIAEQVSHHPPVSAFYVTNRQDGFCICGSILAKSKFYGNSLSAILDGTARLSLLTRGEDYTLTMPYAHCKGILMGTLTMELGGKVNICCEKTGYSTELEFKLRVSVVMHYDHNEERLLWNPNSEIRASRLKRYTVPVVYQEEFESERLWQHVSAAILRGDQVAATEEKTILEEAQRKAAKERQIKLEKWTPKLFLLDLLIGGWIYKHADTRPWDPRNDVLQYEYNYIIQTKTRHRTPVVRTSSIVSGGEELSSKKDLLHMSVEHVITSRPSNCFLQENSVIHRPSVLSHGSESSSPDVEVIQNSDSTESNGSVSHHRSGKPSTITVSLKQCLEPLLKIQEETNQTLQSINNHLESVMAQQHRIQEQLAQRNDISIIIIFMAIQLLFHWLLNIQKLYEPDCFLISESMFSSLDKRHALISLFLTGSVSHHRSGKPSTITVSLKQCLEPLLKIQEETNQTLQSINNHLESVMAQQHRIQEQLAQRNDISIIIIFMAIQLLFHWLL
ncbi:oxysterol-binding protein-related protein 8-like [Centruroides sculpturatus]|uniref:oxysterol-binding protein-related protein 8-like n=1 Tax=Centruroides sculpturatus TaxID=218467 RepID=UPI000C6CCE68|nr:oxysterol-binding protein-related protein 8-like [Centruroides sculpturatus]